MEDSYQVPALYNSKKLLQPQPGLPSSKIQLHQVTTTSSRRPSQAGRKAPSRPTLEFCARNSCSYKQKRIQISHPQIANAKPKLCLHSSTKPTRPYRTHYDERSTF